MSRYFHSLLSSTVGRLLGRLHVMQVKVFQSEFYLILFEKRQLNQMSQKVRYHIQAKLLLLSRVSEV